jgi:hypothetical protein
MLDIRQLTFGHQWGELLPRHRDYVYHHHRPLHQMHLTAIPDYVIAEKLKLTEAI